MGKIFDRGKVEKKTKKVYKVKILNEKYFQDAGKQIKLETYLITNCTFYKNVNCSNGSI